MGAKFINATIFATVPTPVPSQSFFHFRCVALDPAIKGGVINIHTTFGQHLLQFTIADAIFAVPAYRPQNDVALKMSAFEWVHVLLQHQKVTMSLSPADFCNSAAQSMQTIGTAKRFRRAVGGFISRPLSSKATSRLSTLIPKSVQTGSYAGSKNA